MQLELQPICQNILADKQVILVDDYEDQTTKRSVLRVVHASIFIYFYLLRLGSLMNINDEFSWHFSLHKT